MDGATNRYLALITVLQPAWAYGSDEKDYLLLAQAPRLNYIVPPLPGWNARI